MDAEAAIARSLVERARSRDEDAFATLVRPRLAPMLSTASAILGIEAEARDALQETLAKAWRGLPSLRDADRYDVWLTRILVNECRAVLRSRVRRRVREMYVDEHTAERLDQVAAPGDLADELADRDLLDRAFERLDPDARVVLVLHYLEHRSIEDMASVLEVPQGTVKSRLHTARAALQRALERERR
jgi:RNA polymerase sigma-70 factor (ECF subfamily)